MKFRKERLSSLMARELGEMIERQIEFSEGVLVTVTAVEVAANLKTAKVKFAVFPSEKKIEAEKILKANRQSLQSQLFKKMRIMAVPGISFEYDRGAENAAAVEKAGLKQ
jgi:ribosome-binding factor A